MVWRDPNRRSPGGFGKSGASGDPLVRGASQLNPRVDVTRRPPEGHPVMLSDRLAVGPRPRRLTEAIRPANGKHVEAILACKDRRVADELERCPNLFQILGGYLHQDFDLEFASAEVALAASTRESSRARLEAALAELRTHRPSADSEESTKEFVSQLCDYHPPADGLTYVEWLDRVDAALELATST
jgi:hypothetical protein